MSAEQNKILVRRVYDEIINKGNLNVADEAFSSDYVYRSPGSPELRGPEGFKQLVTMYRNAFPDLHLDLDNLIAEKKARPMIVKATMVANIKDVSILELVTRSR